MAQLSKGAAYGKSHFRKYDGLQPRDRRGRFAVMRGNIRGKLSSPTAKRVAKGAALGAAFAVGAYGLNKGVTARSGSRGFNEVAFKGQNTVGLVKTARTNVSRGPGSGRKGGAVLGTGAEVLKAARSARFADGVASKAAKNTPGKSFPASPRMKAVRAVVDLKPGRSVSWTGTENSWTDKSAKVIVKDSRGNPSNVLNRGKKSNGSSDIYEGSIPLASRGNSRIQRQNAQTIKSDLTTLVYGPQTLKQARRSDARATRQLTNADIAQVTSNSGTKVSRLGGAVDKGNSAFARTEARAERRLLNQDYYGAQQRQASYNMAKGKSKPTSKAARVAKKAISGANAGTKLRVGEEGKTLKYAKRPRQEGSAPKRKPRRSNVG